VPEHVALRPAELPATKPNDEMPMADAGTGSSRSARLLTPSPSQDVLALAVPVSIAPGGVRAGGDPAEQSVRRAVAKWGVVATGPHQTVELTTFDALLHVALDPLPT